MIFGTPCWSGINETIDECTQTLSLGRKGVNEHLLLSDAIRSWLQGKKTVPISSLAVSSWLFAGCDRCPQ